MRVSLDDFLDLRSRDRRLARLTHDIVLPVACGLLLGPVAARLTLPERFQVATLADGSAPTRRNGEAYDFAIAVNVAQNAPDPVAWYLSLFDVLRPGGVLNLSLPDRTRAAARDAWVYTPHSFLDFVEGATRVGVFPFVISQFAATEANAAEFYVCLRRDVEEAPARVREMQMVAIAHVRRLAERGL